MINSEQIKVQVAALARGFSSGTRFYHSATGGCLGVEPDGRWTLNRGGEWAHGTTAAELAAVLDQTARRADDPTTQVE